MKNKYLLLTPILIGLITSCGCSPEFRADLEEFIYPISFDTSFIHVSKASLVASRVATSLDTNEEIGKETVYYFIDKKDEENMIYHVQINRSGILKTEDIPSYFEKHYFKEGDTYKFIGYKDEVKTSSDTDRDYILKEMDNFFFLSNKNNLKSQGMYYGDELKQMARMQNFLEVNETKDMLKIEVNDLNVDGVKTFYKLFIDSYGMLNSAHYDMSDEEKRLLIDVDIKYNEEAIYAPLTK